MSSGSEPRDGGVSTERDQPAVIRETTLARDVRFALAGLFVVFAVVAVLNFRTWHKEHEAVAELLSETGLDERQPDVARDALRDPDPVFGRLVIARALVAESFDFAPFSQLSELDAIDAASRVCDRLELARDLAASALVQRPAAWQAAMIMGAATYRLWSLRGDPRLFTDRQAWERPLEVAEKLAPTEDEPVRFRALAYLEIWPALTAPEQATARTLIRRAFEDPDTYNLGVEAWLVDAGDRDTAFSLIPDDPKAWSLLQRIYAKRKDWDGFAAAWNQREAALGRQLKEKLEEAQARLRGGDPSGATTRVKEIIAAAPPDRRWAGIVEKALLLMPAAAPDPMYARSFDGWLSWALDGFVRDDARLSAKAVARLASGVDDLSSPENALAALASGNLTAAELLERRSEALNTEPWAPYCIARARYLVRHRDIPGAQAILARTQSEWRGTIAAIEVRREIAQASADDAATNAAERDLDALEGGPWPAIDWRWHGLTASMEIVVPDGGAAGIQILVDVAPVDGAVVQIRVDGEGLLVTPAHQGATIAAPTALAAGGHLICVTTVAGGRVAPGVVALLRSAP